MSRHWSEFFGRDATAMDYVKAAEESGRDLSEMLKEDFCNLYSDPRDLEPEPDFERMAEQIREEAKEESEADWNYTTEEISSTDLLEELQQLAAQGYSCETGVIQIGDHAERADFLYCPDIGRLGVAWGADAAWADVDDLESGLEMYVNDGEEFSRRN